MQNNLSDFNISHLSPNQNPPTKSLNKRHLIKFFLIFVLILVIAGGMYYAWGHFLSPSAQYARQAEENYQKYLDQQKNYEEAMKADTYGGKTPQETLNMFVDALKKGDTELASKYFLLGGKISQSDWKTGLDQKKSDGKLADIINMVEKSIFDEKSSWQETAWFIQKTNTIGNSILLKLNKYSNVWKIENM